MDGFDVIVVGLGAHGSASLRALSASGARVLGIDRFSPPHAEGSSHGETRITRVGVGEGASYAPLAARSHEVWRELEAETGLNLFTACGALIMAPAGGGARHHGADDFLGVSIAVARQFGVPHEVLEADALAARFPQLELEGDERAYFEPGGGFVRPERCVEAQLRVAEARGAVIRRNERVLSVEPEGSGVLVRTDRGSYRADRAVIAAGAWLPEFAGTSVQPLMKVYRQILFWFEPEDRAAYAPDRFPVFIRVWGRGLDEYNYGFPVPADGTPGFKIATEQYNVPIDPNSVDRSVGEADAEAMYRQHVAGRFRGIRPRVLKSATCFYTTTPDAHFIVEPRQDSERILLVSACSGHGFKHSAGLGEAVAGAVVGDRAAMALLAPFASRRFPTAA